MQVENGSVEALGSRIVENVGRVLVGKAAEVELCVIALLSRGHILIEDVPGVGKTMLAKSLARSLSCGFERLQFTPDLLPSDVTGVNIYSPSTQQFEFRQGPIFTQILLADEINRATPKTQSALLEAMEEKQVTVDGTTYPLPLPFLVLATQNPVEFAGTFPLPEAQVDRFLMRVNLGYLDIAHEVQVLDRFQRESPIEQLEHGGDVRRPVDVMAHVLGILQLICGLRVATFDEFLALRKGKAQLGHAAVAIEDAELQVLVMDESDVVGASRDTHPGPAVKLAGDLIDERGRTGHPAILPRAAHRRPQPGRNRLRA